jgi:hypothetical protein
MKEKLEDEFVRKLEMFLDEDFNDFSKRRIKSFLSEYREQIPPITIIKDKIILKEKIVYRTFKDLVDAPEPKRRTYKVYVSNDILMSDAKELCKSYNMTLEKFFSRSKVTMEVGKLRKIFCVNIFERYFCTNNILADFFGVHHSTISFYLYDKRLRRKDQTPKRDISYTQKKSYA